MCFTNDFPTLEILKNAEDLNSHGSGIAWIDGEQVKFKKGFISSKDLIAIIKKEKIKLPFVIHFRIKSSGIITDSLSHPYPLDATKLNDLEGFTDAVLFHNGTWSDHDWKEILLQTCLSRNLKIPDGYLSDSKILAFLTSIYGYNLLKLVGGYNDKMVILDKNGINYFGDGWKEIEKNKFSNDFFIKEDKTEELTWFTKYTPKKPTIDQNTKKIFPIRVFNDDLIFNDDLTELTEIQKQELYKKNEDIIEQKEDSLNSLYINLQNYKKNHPKDKKLKQIKRRISKLEYQISDLTLNNEDLFQNSNIKNQIGDSFDEVIENFNGYMGY